MNCEYCGTLGLLRAQNAEEKIDTIIKCNCEWGKRQIWKLPFTNKKISSSFTISKCPLNWFRPDNPKGTYIVGGLFDHSTQKKIDGLTERIKIAEVWWASGFASLFEEEKHHLQNR
jgi:hypothetical protein